ncbi:hypothetical protein MRX96_015620 [Rhipicephalus microplus]
MCVPFGGKFRAVPLLFRTRRTGLLQVPSDQTSSPGRLSIARQQSGVRIHTHQTTSSARHRASRILPLPSAAEKTRVPSAVRAKRTRADASGPSSHPAGPEFRRGLVATRREEEAGGGTCGSSAVPLNGNRYAKRSQRKGHTRAHRSSSCLNLKERTFTVAKFLESHAARCMSMPRRVQEEKKSAAVFKVSPRRLRPPAQRDRGAIERNRRDFNHGAHLSKDARPASYHFQHSAPRRQHAAESVTVYQQSALHPRAKQIWPRHTTNTHTQQRSSPIRTHDGESPRAPPSEGAHLRCEALRAPRPAYRSS